MRSNFILGNHEWLKTSHADEFARQLAQSFIKNVTKAEAADKKKLKKIFREIEKMDTQIAIFKNQHKINFFSKAKIANTFKWELRNAGYEFDLVDEVTNVLVLKL